MSINNKEKVFKSVCRICHGGCSALLYVRDGKLVRVKPDPESPFNRGQMCIRGSNQWKRIDWDTALKEIADRLDSIRKESGPESIALGQGTGRHHFMHVIRFANSLGTPNWYEPGLANCFMPRAILHTAVLSSQTTTAKSFQRLFYFGDIILLLPVRMANFHSL
jgi:anaerobic selenocysteine-containing dehydrogenase